MKGSKAIYTGKSVTSVKEKVASKAKGKWMSSTATRGQLDRLSDAEYLLPSEVATARSPVTLAWNSDVWGEAVPQPEPNERVCFIPFLICGLGFPIHPFLRGLLHF